MKKIYLFLAVVASVALVGCTSEELLQTEATVDEAAQGQTPILFSAGKIGYQVEVSPEDLAKVIKYQLADICE